MVLFLDLDYFFAQVEEVEKPEYRDRPLVVCVYSGRTESSGVVSSANYVARRYGVKAGMPIRLAMGKLPSDSVYLPVRMEHYLKVSRDVMDIARKYSAKMRVESVDEAVLDVTEVVDGSFDKAREHAAKLKTEILERKSLKCSVGVAPNRVLAKMAAEAAKPDGLKVVNPEEVGVFLAGQPVEALPGVGHKTKSLLEDLGVRTVADLGRLDIDVLENVFGPKKARYVYLASRGLFDEPVQERGAAKQVSRILTLKRNTRSLDEVEHALAKALTQVLNRLSSLRMAATRLGIIVITSEIKTFTKQVEIRPGSSYDELMRLLRSMLQQVLSENPSLMLRRLGVRMSGLLSLTGQSTLTAWSEHES
ncbi:MAG: DNA polymerase IV [Candidatus Caldarchaeum sp.]